jgi:hypothetical protein
MVEATRIVGVSTALGYSARIVLKHGTAAEIRAIEQGDHEPGAGISNLARQIRLGLSPAQRRRLAQIPMEERGDFPSRIRTQRLKGMVWRQLCQALEAADLPRTEDVVDIARRFDRSGLVDRKLLRAHERLGELIELWTRPTHNTEK